MADFVFRKDINFTKKGVNYNQLSALTAFAKIIHYSVKKIKEVILTKKIVKILCLLLTAVLFLSIGITAYAVNETNSPLKIEISTDKSEYSTLGTAKITATITNTSNADIQNVSAEALFHDLAPIGNDSKTKSEVETLKAGESFSFTYKATINKDAYKLNILQRFFLLIVRLFGGGYSVGDNGFDDGRTFLARTDVLTFGKFSANNEVKVWYGENGGENPDTPEETYFSSDEAKDMNTVDTSLNQLMSSDNYINVEQDEKSNLVKKQLSKLEKEGLIKENSINYNESTKVFHFEYTCGIAGCVVVDEQKKYSDPWLNSVGFTNNNHLETLLRQKETTVNKSSDISKTISSVLLYGYDEERYELINGSWQPAKRCLID